MQNTVPTPFWQPEMTQNAEICKKIALLWTGLHFNTGFMAPLKSHPYYLDEILSYSLPIIKVEKKFFSKKSCWKFQNICQTQAKSIPTPTHTKHNTRHRQIFTQWARGLALQDLNGASIWYIQALQTMASSYTKVHPHEPLDFNIAKCGKPYFR